MQVDGRVDLRMVELHQDVRAGDPEMGGAEGEEGGGVETADPDDVELRIAGRSEEHTSELQSLMRISYAVFCLKKKMRREHKNNENSSIHIQLDPKDKIT